MSQSADERSDEIGLAIADMGSAPKAEVFARMDAFDIGEPVRVEGSGSGAEEVYEYRRQYLGNRIYDRVVVHFQDGRLSSYDVKSVR